MSALWSDLRVAVRVLRKSPGFALAAIGALALGIGPNTAIFSLVYATLLAPLPFPNPEQIVMLWSQVGQNRQLTSAADYRDWKAQARSFQYMEPIMPRYFNLAAPEAPERVRARQTSPDGHRMWGEGVWLGRDFAPGEDQPGKNHVVLLSHRIWRDRFGADPGIIGREIRMDDEPYAVIGVLRPGVNDRLPADLWIPLALKPDETDNRRFRPFLVAARLKPGVTIAQAQQEMNAIAAGLARQFPATNAERTVSVESLQGNFISAASARNLWLLLAAVSFVVLIACVNVTNLLLSRGAARERETAIRAALGATRGQLVRRALTDSLLLAAAGGTLGTLSSVWILQGILALLPRGSLPAEVDPRLSLPVLLFTLGATIACGLLCGAAQAWQTSRADWNDTLKQAGRGATGSGRRSLRHALVVVEFALAVTLLAGAALTIVSFWQRTQIDLGLRAERVLTFGLPINAARFSSATELDGFSRQLLERFQAVPGVTHATISAPGLPLVGTGFSRPFRIVGQADDPSESRRPAAGVTIVTPGYFDTFGIDLVRGRTFLAHDGPGAQRVALVNARFAERFLDGRDPVSQRVVLEGFVAGTRGLPGVDDRPGPPAEWHIVGVVGNVSTLDRFGDPDVPQIYLPFAQSPWSQMTAAVRAATDPDTLRRSLVAAVQRVEPGLPLTDVRTLDAIIGEYLASDRLNIALYGGLAALALVLAALGIYGVMAYTVAQRTQEIGLRMALGAGQRDVQAQVLREGLTLAAAGLLFGLLGAYGLGRAMQSTLYGTSTLSVPMLMAVATVLLATAALACYVPARRASAVDPMIALRQD